MQFLPDSMPALAGFAIRFSNPPADSAGRVPRGPGNAVKEFCSRIRENSGIRHEAIPKSHDFVYEKLPVFSTKIPRRRWGPGRPALSCQPECEKAWPELVDKVQSLPTRMTASLVRLERLFRTVEFAHASIGYLSPNFR